MDFFKLIGRTKYFNIKKLLHERIPYQQEGREYSKVYASDLAVTAPSQIFCPREHVLAIQNGVKRDSDVINTALSMTFKYGKFYEDNIRRILKSEAIGTWQCNFCGMRQYYTKLPKRCHDSYCQVYNSSPWFTYKGMYVQDPIYKYRCGIDLLLDLTDHGETTYKIVEIKTIKDDKFKELSKPLSNHQLQVRLYLQAIESAKKINTSKSVRNTFLSKIDTTYAYVLYAVKGFGVKDISVREYNRYDYFSPFKQFIIKNDEDDFILQQKNKLLELSNFQDTAIMPTRVCMSVKDRRATKCPVKEICFAKDK